MVSVDGLTVEFGGTTLFSDISFVINEKDRIALMGKNGAGKSTMLKIIAGVEQPTGGGVSVPKGTTVGYLPQVMVLSDSCTVRQETEKAFAHLHEIQADIKRMEQEMAQRDDYESESYMQLCERFTHESERLEMMGGSEYMGKLERTLMGLGFRQGDMERPTSEFSGGWRMRIELAKILLQHPDVLLLDEPTNHLDIESIQWLEQFLATYSGAVMLVSHDRAFINNVTNLGNLTYKCIYTTPNFGGIAGVWTGNALIQNSQCYCNIDAGETPVGWLVGAARSATAYTENCAIGGTLITGWDNSDYPPTPRGSQILEDDYMNYMYATGQSTDWNGTENYDGCRYLSEAPAIQ